LRFVLLIFQRFPIIPGNSMQHGCDMEHEFCRPRSADFQGANYKFSLFDFLLRTGVQ
jgi:hypothetical protein